MGLSYIYFSVGYRWFYLLLLGYLLLRIPLKQVHTAFDTQRWINLSVPKSNYKSVN